MPKPQREPILTEEERNKEILAHLDLVDRIATRKSAAHLVKDGRGEAREGLVTASLRYDPSKGTSFKTYCVRWVKARLDRLSQNARCVKIFRTRAGRKIYNRFFKAQQVCNNHGVEITFDIVARYTGAPMDEIEEIVPLINTPEVSLSTPIGDDSPFTLEDYIPDGQDLFEIISTSERNARIRQICEEYLRTSRDPRERVILMDCYLNETHSLEKAGAQFDLTKQRMAQIANKMRKRLAERLKEFDPSLEG